MEGVYGAIFRLEETRTVEVGALGKIDFQPGMYVYVGSAMNGVESRLERHFSPVENLHWHIDYFSAEAEAVEFLVVPDGPEAECMVAEAASRVGEPVEGFGCSDCGCSSHLFRIGTN